MSMWFAVFALVQLPGIVRSWARGWVTRARGQLAPRPIGRTGGHWLGEELARRHLHRSVRACDDCAWFRGRDVQLGQELDETDAIAWGIAAHQLGHAILGGVVSRVVRVARRGAFAAGVALAAGNVLYAVPDVTTAAFGCFAAAVVLDVLELATELAASRGAAAEIARHVSPMHVGVATAALHRGAVAHVAQVGARAALLLAWPIVVHLTRDGWSGAPAQLGPFGLVFVLGVVALGAVRAVRWRSWLGVVFPLALTGALALMWNLRTDPAWIACVFLALVPAHGVIVMMLALPLVYPAMLITRGMHARDDATYRDARQASARALLTTAGAFAEWLDRITPRTTPLDLLYLPLFALWLTGGGFTM